MKNQSSEGRRFIMLPSSLLPVLSDTALRIILYAIYRERLVELGYLKDWCLYLTDVHNRFGKLKGYSLNTIRKGIRELVALNLINLKDGEYYDLNIDELKKWFQKDSSLGLPNSGREGLPKSGRAGLPKSGSQEKSIKKKSNKREEREISPIPKAPAQPPVNRKMSAEEFEKIFPKPEGYVPRPKKTRAEEFEETFRDVFPAAAPEAPEKKSTVSGTAAEPLGKVSLAISGQTARETTPATDTDRRPSDSVAPKEGQQNPQPSVTVPKTKETPAQRRRKEIIGQLYTLWLVHGKRGPFPPPDLEEQVAKYM
jgi:hypothetical protein